MSSDAVYRTSPVKPSGRVRSTKSEVENRREALLAIVAAARPASVRQVFYQASVHGLVAKSERGYRRVQEDLAHMRRIGGELPRSWIADGTRWQRRPITHAGIEAALLDTARMYRKSLWASAACYCELWCEKDALSGVLYPVTSTFDVPLLVSRGYASISFLSSAAEAIAEQGKPAFIFHLGDHDPSGVDAARVIETRLREYAPNAQIFFERLAVLPEQIVAWHLPSRPTKQSDTRAKGFSAASVELDAIPAQALRDLVQAAIERHLPPHELAVLQAAEHSERHLLKSLVNIMRPAMGAGDV